MKYDNHGALEERTRREVLTGRVPHFCIQEIATTQKTQTVDISERNLTQVKIQGFSGTKSWLLCIFYCPTPNANKVFRDLLQDFSTTGIALYFTA